MKKLLWKPSKISWHIHVVIAIIAIIAMISVEVFKKEKKQRHYNEKIKAANIMKTAFKAIEKYRINNGMTIDANVDPTKSGLMGIRTSSVTSVKGEYEAKLATINPNWAAVLVDMLKTAGVKKGDTICVAFSGSFPALNIAVYSAANALNLSIIGISSSAASSWGANIPNLLWIDMEQIFYNEKIFPYKSVAASLGGVKDDATGMSPAGKNLLLKTIKKHGLQFINVQDTTENIDMRVSIYLEKAGSNKIAAFINSGGGTITVGSAMGKKSYDPGLNMRPSRKALKIDSVMTRFAKEGVPLIHLTQTNKIAAKYNLETSHKQMPIIGRGAIYKQKDYSKTLVLISLAVIILSLYVLIKQGKGYRMFAVKIKGTKGASSPEHMV